MPSDNSTNALVEAISEIGKLGQVLNSDELRESMHQIGSLLSPGRNLPEQPKDQRKRLCPIVSCCKCHAHNVTLYTYGDKRICKKCKKELEP